MQDLEQKHFQRYLIISVILHMIFLCVGFYGIPPFRKTAPDQEIIIFDVIDAADVPNIRNQTPKPNKEPEIKESQRINKISPAQEIKEELKQEEYKPKIEQKIAEIMPEKKEPEKKEPEKKAKIQIPKKEEKKKEEPKILPKKSQSKNDLKVKKPAQKEEDIIDDILKKLEKESEGQETNSPNRDISSSAYEGKFAKGNNNFNEDSPLSITEKMLIKKQVENNWRPPVGIANIENVQVILHLKILEDGTIISVKIKEVICPGNTETCDLVAQSAARATKKASPLKNLRPDRYDVWKTLDLRFDPSGVLW